MIKKIKNHIEYKKKVKLLKMIAVNNLTNFVINKNDYVVGFNKLLLTMANTDNADELQKTLNDYLTALKATVKANDVLGKENNNDK